MPRWTNSDKARIEYRRTMVARLSAVGLRLYEIVDKLVEGGIINPDTGEPYDTATISRDISEIRARWREESTKEVAEHKARQFAELREARRKAWSDGDVSEVRLNIATEMKLLGTESPSKMEHTGPDGESITSGLESAIAKIYERHNEPAEDETG